MVTYVKIIIVHHLREHPLCILALVVAFEILMRLPHHCDTLLTQEKDAEL